MRLAGALASGVTATDLVLTMTERLRKHGVVGKFIEFFGPGLGSLTVADRATISNMSPEFGATASTFPVDGKTLRLSARHRPRGRARRPRRALHQGAGPLPRRSEARAGLHRDARLRPVGGRAEPRGSAPAAGSRSLPQGRRQLRRRVRSRAKRRRPGRRLGRHLGDHSCTNTSNPALMVAAGLVARKAVERGLTTKPWVKTSLAPGSRVVIGYLRRGGADGAARARSASTSSASAARPASGTPARCPTRWPARSSATT